MSRRSPSGEAAPERLQLDALLDDAPALIGYWDADGRSRFANAAYRAWLGVADAELEGMHISEALGPERYALNRPHIAAALAGEAQVFERPVVEADGRERTMRAEYAPHRVDGRRQGFFVLVTDVSAQVDAARAAAGARAHLEAVIHAVPVAVWSGSRGGTALISEQWARMAGQSLEGWTPERWREVIHPADRANVDAAWERFDRGDGPFAEQYRILRADSGEERIVLDRGVMVEGVDGVDWVGITEDITERIAAEGALRARDALQQSIFAALGEGVLVLDAAGRVVTANASAEELLSVPADRMRGQSLSGLLGTAVRQDGSDAPGEQHPWTATLASGDAVHGAILGVRQAGGRLVWLYVNVEALAIPSDERPGAVVTLGDITEEIAAQQALELTQARLTAVVEAAPLSVWSYDANGEGVFISGRWREITGQQGAAWDAEAWHSMMHPDDAERVEGAWERLLAGDGPFHEQYRIFRADTGEERTIVERATAVSGVEGVSVVGTTEDVTDDLLAADALRAREALLESIFAAVGEGIAVQDADGRILSCNASAEEILGLSADQLMGRTSVDPRWRAVYEDGSDWPGETHPAMVTLATGEPQHDVIMGVHKPDGRLTWVSINSEPLDLPGDARRGVVVTFADVTERTLALREIEASNRRLEAVMDTVPTAIWSYDAQGNGLTMSERGIEMTGQSREEWAAEGWLAVVHPDDLPRVEAAWRRTLRERVPYQQQFRIRHRVTGEERIVLERARAVESGGGVAFTGSTEDVTALVEAGSAARELAAEQRSLRRIAELVARRAEPSEVFSQVAIEAEALMACDGAWVMRCDDDARGTIVASSMADDQGLGAIGSPVDLGLPTASAEVMRSGLPVRLKTAEHPGALWPEFSERVALPIRIGDRLWGTLSVAQRAGGALPAGTEQRLSGFAELVALAITESEAREALAQRATLQAELNRLAELALAGSELAPLFDAAVGLVVEQFEVISASIVELTADGHIHVRAAAGSAPAELGTRGPLLRGQLTAAAISEGEPSLCADLANDPRVVYTERMATIGARSGVAVPIRMQGRVWGALNFLADRADAASSERALDLAAIANVLGSAVERDHAEARLRHQAWHDPLTGIPNRSLLIQRLGESLERCAEGGGLATVICIGLDHFKVVNDTMGPAHGDALLLAVAERLTAAVGPRCTVARLGGDHFGVLCEELAGESEALGLAERLIAALGDPEAEGGALAAASAGCVVRGSGDTAEHALRDADTALYRAKGEGRGHARLFDAAMRKRLVANHQLERDLVRALASDELSLSYQPIVSLRDGAVQHLEALLRWQHPERGALAPVSFIAIAEETGMILPVGRWVIERACADAARFNALRPADAPISVTINLSARQLADAGLCEHVERCLAASAIPAGRIGFEITETSLLDQNPVHTDRLHELRALGVRLLLDDFGTGYSSLGYIQRFPIDTLKIDRSLISKLGHDASLTAITTAIFQMARALDLQVIAEGIDADHQLIALRALGCTSVQGYFFARPLTRGKAERLLAGSPPWLADKRARSFGLGPH